MKMICSIAEDLLPLYLEDACLPDTKTALEAHLAECPACREKLRRMQSAVPTAGPERVRLAGYAQKVRRRRIRLAVRTVLASVAAALMVSLCLLVAWDMRLQSDPDVFPVEAGTTNLTAGTITDTADHIGAYTLYTNYQQIEVTVEQAGDFQGDILLYNAAAPQAPIRTAHVSKKNNICTFTGLSAAQRYLVGSEGLDGAVLTVSEGRKVSVWNSLRHVWEQLIPAL